MKVLREYAFLILAALIALAGFTFALFKPRSDQALTETFSPDRYLIPQEPVTQFAVKKVAAASKELEAAELILGVCIGKEARAYPINMLNHEPANKVINDVLAGQPIMATWCDNAHNAIVYSRQVNGKTLTFGVAGQMWKGSLVMYDRETWTRWSHLPGLAKLGPLKDMTLEPVPSVITDWETWRKLYPEGTVAILSVGYKEYTPEIYDEEPMGFLLGIAAGSQSRTWSFSELSKTPAINDFWQGEPVLAVLIHKSRTARLYQRTVQGKILTFKLQGQYLNDQETGTSWEPISGQGRAGPLAAQWLVPLSAFVSYRKIWENFHGRKR